MASADTEIRRGMAGAAATPAALIGARLDRLPSSWPVWRLVLLISLGGCFEYRDAMMTADASPGVCAFNPGGGRAG